MKFSLFTVFTADMVEKKGAPPRVKTIKKKKTFFTVFTADMVEKKGCPPGKNGKKK